MIKLKIGNDVRMDISVFRRNEVPEDFSQVIDMRVFLKREGLPQEIEPPYEVTGNMIRLNFLGESQSHIGTYRAFIHYSKSNIFRNPPVTPHAIDTLAFELVQYDQDATEGEDYIVTTIALVDLNKDGKDGADAYQIWEAQPGNAGKSIEEYMEWIQEPAKTAATASENQRQLAIEATAKANQAATDANNAAGEANAAKIATNNAAAFAEEEGDRANAAATNANIKAQQADAAKTEALQAAYNAQSAADRLNGVTFEYNDNGKLTISNL